MKQSRNESEGDGGIPAGESRLEGMRTVSVCICVFGVIEVKRSHFTRMQGSSLFFLPGETLTEREKIEG